MQWRMDIGLFAMCFVYKIGMPIAGQGWEYMCVLSVNQQIVYVLSDVACTVVLRTTFLSILHDESEITLSQNAIV